MMRQLFSQPWCVCTCVFARMPEHGLMCTCFVRVFVCVCDIAHLTMRRLRTSWRFYSRSTLVLALFVSLCYFIFVFLNSNQVKPCLDFFARMLGPANDGASAWSVRDEVALPLHVQLHA